MKRIPMLLTSVVFLLTIFLFIPAPTNADAPTTKSPGCRDGFREVIGYSGAMAGCPDAVKQSITSQCCKGTFGACVDGSGQTIQGAQFMACSQLQSRLILTPKDNCGSDGSFKYANGTCVATGTTNNFFNTQKGCATNGVGGVDTAIGCIPTDDLPSLLTFLLRFGFGISGGITLLMIIITGYEVITSSGNPEKLQAAKENVVSIFSGVVLIAFSVVLLQTVGVNILKLVTF